MNPESRPMPPLYFVHISDSHIGPARTFELYGQNAFDNATRVVQVINTLPVKPDFVIHTGDIAAYPNDEAYKIAASVFSKLHVPVYFVTGNHDLSRKIHEFMPSSERDDHFVDENLLAYSFERKGFRCVTLDARGPDEIDPAGLLGDPQFEFLDEVILRDTMPLVLFVHFPALPVDSQWFDESMLIRNGDALHNKLVPVRERIRGVFSGHVHRGMQIVKDGILYSSVASLVGQFNAWPYDAKPQSDPEHPPCFNFVTIIGNQTIVKEHILPSHFPIL